ncbi:MAG: hypothetical protein PHP22_10575 [Oscillospiraceae bacterium]|nr:hypothetical protein [Oscillospiraceae bacterium]
MELRVFRLPRKWMINPRLREYGIAAIIFSLLSALILYVFSLGNEGLVIMIFGVFSGMAGLAGIAMIVLGMRQDPDFIHSFALCEDGTLYHVMTWIPGREADFKSFPDNMTPSKLLEKRRQNFSDVADFINTDEFTRCVRLAIEGKASDHPLQQYVITRRMNDPKMIRHYFDYELISYTSGSSARPNSARLYQQNDGYDRILLAMRRIRENVPNPS